MRVFVAGATGALGRPVVRLLVEIGHEVVGMTRHADKRAALESMGAQAVVADALDGEALVRAVAEAGPTHVVQLLTALPPEGPLRARQLRATNRLRTQGTANLIRAARGAGVRRFVAESFIGAYGAADFDRPADEETMLPPPPRGAFHDAVLAIRAHERMLRDARAAGLETVVVRFGLFYGPEVPSTVALAHRLRARQVVVPRGATGVGSFIHVDDAATAVRAALESAAPAPLYNVVDDEPMPITTFLTLAARAFSAPEPRQVPAWLVRLLAPIPATAAFTRLPLTNAKARRELGWRPAHPSVREGLRETAEVASREPRRRAAAAG